MRELREAVEAGGWGQTPCGKGEGKAVGVGLIGYSARKKGAVTCSSVSRDTSPTTLPRRLSRLEHSPPPPDPGNQHSPVELSGAV